MAKSFGSGEAPNVGATQKPDKTNARNRLIAPSGLYQNRRALGEHIGLSETDLLNTKALTGAVEANSVREKSAAAYLP
jgi:hypothetical protein